MHRRYKTSTLLTFVQSKSNFCWCVHERIECSYSHHQWPAGNTFKQWHLLIKFKRHTMSECSCTKKNVHVCLYLPPQQGRPVLTRKTCQNQNEISLKQELLPTPEAVETFIDGFSATGSRSADLINKDSACAKAKKIAFVENEKWIKPAEKLAASDKGGSNPADGAQPSADASHSSRTRTGRRQMPRTG